MKTVNVVAVIVVGALAVACGGGNAAEGGGAKAPDGKAATDTTTGGTAAVPGGSLAEQEVWGKLNEEMAGYIKDVNTACGTSIKGTYDTASYKGKFKDGESYGVSSYARSSCQSLIQSVRDLCTNSEPGKARVKSKIKVITCQYGAPGQKPNVSLKGDAFTGQFDPDAGGAVMSSAADEWLKKSL